MDALEKGNIKQIQVFLDSLEKTPLNHDTNKKVVKLPSSMFSKTLGIYCEVGHVTDPKGIEISFLSTLYKTTLYPTPGKNVVVFIPIYYREDFHSVKIEDNNQCKSYFYSDLKDWKGALWEGSYDREGL